MELSLKNYSHQRQNFLPHLGQFEEMLDYDAESVDDSTHTDFSGAIDGKDKVVSLCDKDCCDC